MAQRFSVDAVFRAIDRVTAPVNRMSRRVNIASRKMERSLGKVNRVFGKISRGAAGAGRAIGAATLVAGAGLAKVVSTGAQFEQTLVNAGSKFAEPIDRGTKAFDELTEAALKVSSATEFTASEAAGALDFMAKAGENAQVSMAALGTFADLATVAQVDLATAADLASDAIGPLGLATDDLSKKAGAYAQTADLMAKTSNMANLSVNELFESVVAGAGGFRAAGQETNQFLASVALLAGQGIKGSKAGKDLARAITRMTNSATKAPKALKRVGVSVTDAKGNIRDFIDVMDDFEKKLKKLSEAKRQQAITDVFGAQSKAAGVAILDNIDKVRQFEKNLDSATGTTQTLAAKGRDTALAKIKEFWSTVEAIVVKVFFVIRDDVVKITDIMTDWARANKEVFSEKVKAFITFFKDNFDKIAKLTPRVLIFVGSILALSKALAFLQVIMGLLAAVTTVTAGTMLLVAGSVVVLVAALAILIFHWDEVVTLAQDLWWLFTNKVAGAIDSVTSLWESMITGIREGNPAWIAALVVMSPIIGAVGTIVLLIEGLTAAWNILGEFLEVAWPEIMDNVFRSMVAVTDEINALKKEFNNLTGSAFFDVEVETNRRASEDATRFRRGGPGFLAPKAVAGPSADSVDRITAANTPTPLAAANTPPPETTPQVVNTTSEQISRTVMETVRTMKLDVNLKDPGGVVESVEQKDTGDAVRVVSSGAL